MNIEEVSKKLRKVVDEIVELDLIYEGNIHSIDYFTLFCKATALDKLYHFLGLNTCMFNCTYEGEEAVLLLFSIPINTESSAKNTADKIMELVKLTEHCFVTLDYISTEEVKEDKFIYVTIIKKIGVIKCEEK